MILGGCGFIGRHVAILLARLGAQVTLADRTPPAYCFPDDVREQIGWTPFHLSRVDWPSLIGSYEVIHHYAWTSLPASANANPLADLNVNVLASVGLLEAVRERGCGRVIFSSSGGTVYGRAQQVPVTEKHPLLPITAYGASKATAEMYLGLYRELYGIDSRIARIANAYGAGQNLARGQGAATRFLNCALRNEPIVIWGDGEVVRDFIHVTDVARALVELASLSPEPDSYIYNIGSGCGTSLNKIIAELEIRLGYRLTVTREEGRSFDVPISVLDISLAQQELGWSPALNFAEGIGRTMCDLETNPALSTFGAMMATCSR